MGENRSDCKTSNGVIASMEDSRTESSKRRKISSSNVQLQCRHHRLLKKSPAISTSLDSSSDSGEVTVRSCSDGFPESRSCTAGSSELREFLRLRSTDLEEAQSFETEISMFTDDNFSGETSPATELCRGDTEELDSPSKPNLLRGSPAGKTPMAEEIEEFFVEAEKHEAKRFAEKYNYDIVKDVPLEGRYQWVLLKP